MSVEIEHYFQVVAATDLPGFKTSHGDAFLVRSSKDGALELDEQTEIETSPGRSRKDPTELVLPAFRDMEAIGRSNYYVYPVKPRRSAATEITVGRVSAMDVCIPDRSISRLHAVFAPLGDGRYRLEDKDSRNGTFLARKQLEPGKPQIVRSGQTVQLGNVVFAFFQASQFVDFVYKIRDGGKD